VATIGNLQLWVTVWIVVAILLFIRHWRSGQGVGLLLTYVVCLGSIDWLASALFLLPWNPATGLQFVTDGMRLSAIAITAVAVGAEIVTWWWSRREARRGVGESDAPMQVDPASVNLYLILGLTLHVVLAPLARSIPSIGALVSTGSSLLVVGLGLKCWNAWHDGRRGGVWLWLASTMLLPFFTVVTMGFLGYGLAAMVMVLAFVGAFYRPRWRVLVMGVAFGYLGLSVYVTYMRDRNDIRTLVKAGASLSDRVAAIQATASDPEWFNVHDISHLARVEDRLDQNWLVGAAVAKLSSGTVPFARGSTIQDAALAIVPRMFWPEKTVAVGSGDLVSRFTGLSFQGDTSVGIGQLMEWYVNFGETGVIVGFLVIGALVTIVDRMAHDRLVSGDIGSFLVWYMPGLNLLNVGGSFVDMTSAAAAAGVMALIMKVVVSHVFAPAPRARLAYSGDRVADDGSR
jgi:hypothetical protein